ncbi:hypothetical protein FA13DRAFT_1889042 [Coprinellus micaceus]|uniref:Uncharacterized protein n=1 Tax=Coprinellus micaceus TaxID=71717 RepID=A0A4Y7SXL3_COPMI|nr:hypothetical protein FA13DRAFT_1889042 [Coprinellus micaceus]
MSRQAHQSLVRNSRSWTSIAVYDTLRLDRRIDYFGILQLVYTLIMIFFRRVRERVSRYGALAHLSARWRLMPTLCEARPTRIGLPLRSHIPADFMSLNPIELEMLRYLYYRPPVGLKAFRLRQTNFTSGYLGISGGP